jgi:hypothetical protein
VFAQARSRFTAFAYIAALLAVAGDRKSCWQLGEEAGHATPRRMQALLAEYCWDWGAALGRLQQFILAHLGDPGAILVLDETAELKKGTMTVGVGRQHAGITGQVENCQTVVFLAYVTPARTRSSISGSTCRNSGVRRRRGASGRRSAATRRSGPRPGRAPAWSPGQSPAACRSGGWPTTRSTAAAQSCGRPARTPGKAMSSRSR